MKKIENMMVLDLQKLKYSIFSNICIAKQYLTKEGSLKNAKTIQQLISSHQNKKNI